MAKQTKSTYTEFKVNEPTTMTNQSGGMIRSDTKDKINWSLVSDGPLLKRLAILLTKGAEIYGKRNWMKSKDDTEINVAITEERFRESAYRHFMQWYNGDRDEDHMAATAFNMNGAEYLNE